MNSTLRSDSGCDHATDPVHPGLAARGVGPQDMVAGLCEQ